MSEVDFPRPLIFATYAGKSLGKWSESIGEQVIHRRFGTGEIIDVRLSTAGDIVISIAFVNDDHPKRDLTSCVFRSTHVILDMSASKAIEGIDRVRATLLEERVQQQKKKEEREWRRHQEEREQQGLVEQRAREAQAREEFAFLKEKYGVLNYRCLNPTSPLYPILLSLESGETPRSDLMEWLRDQRIRGPLAHIEEQSYERTGEVWCLVRASRMWREVDQPLRAIHATSKAPASNVPANARSALLTTRGAAYCDLKYLDEAENCAKQAITVQSQSHYAYNLLGAIYYDRGDPATGDTYFSEALVRGATPKSQDIAVKGAIKKQERESQRSTAEYLLSKDPKRFAWARRYVE